MTQLLLLYYLVFFAAVFVWPSWRTWRRNGINPMVLPGNDTAEGFVGLWFKALIGAVLALMLGLACGLAPQHLGSIGWLEGVPLRCAGVVLLGLSLVMVAWAQATLGSSWRIGIDKAHPMVLVTRGFFARSRNPIFLGLRLNLAGLFLILPNAATLALWLLGEVLMGLQVRLEEAHLHADLGEAYATYAARTPRWL